MPEGQQLVKVQAQRQADLPARGLFVSRVHVRAQLLLLVGVEVQAACVASAGYGLVAAVAADKAPAGGEGIDRQQAAVFAARAARLFGLACEGLKRVKREHRAFTREKGALFFRVERSAVRAHQAGNIGADDVHAQLVFKRAQHRVVIEGAALHDDVLAQLMRAGAADDLVQRVFDDGDGKACGNIGYIRAVLLRLLDGGIHEHRAAGTQVHRLACGKAQLRKRGDVVAKGASERLQERSAAGGTGFIEEDIVDHAVADLEALDVLTADIDDEIDLREEGLGGGKVRDGFNQAEIHAEGIADQILAVTGYRARTDHPVRMLAAQVGKECAHMRHGIAGIGLIAGVKQLALVGYDDGFDRRGAGVNAPDRRRPCSCRDRGGRPLTARGAP